MLTVLQSISFVMYISLLQEKALHIACSVSSRDTHLMMSRSNFIMTKIMFSMRIIGMYIKLWHVSDLLLVRCLKKVSRGRGIEYCQSPDTAQLGRQRKVILPWDQTFIMKTV